MFERPEVGESVLLAHLELQGQGCADLTEFKELAASAGTLVCGTVTGSVDRPNSRFLIGTGKVDEVAAMIKEAGADLVIFNQPLSPSQERNLERALQCRVLDRTGLILDIFAQRARTHEGKLQVELAQLQHLSTRLVRGWTHLERQKGGIGLRGPGETQLETDRRLIGGRIRQLKLSLAKVRQRRTMHRRARQKAFQSQISLVGYTNAGKTTVFNALCDAGAIAADQLFATLDTSYRRVDIPGAGSTVLSDTVGFIRDLPHDLVAAFRATLEEARQADLLLHVIDSSNGDHNEQRQQVNKVLEAIGASSVPRLEVYNKIDRQTDECARLERDSCGIPQRVWVSAASGVGMTLLKEAIRDCLWGGKTPYWLRIPVSAARERAQLYQRGLVVDEAMLDDGAWCVKVQIEKQLLDKLCSLDSGISLATNEVN